MPKISIIVPIYNADKYLSRCIESVLAQSFRNFELLLVDDGSTDKSGDICKKYAKQDHRIQVYHKKNGGVSSARNIGLKHASGEWVLFIDADDELLEHSLNNMINETKRQIDLVVYGYKSYDDNNKLLFSTLQEQRAEVIDANEMIKRLFVWPYYNGYLWNKLFNLLTIKNNHISFNEHIYYNEDRLFCIEYINAIHNAIYYSSFPVYLYRKHNDSAIDISNKCFNKKMISEIDAYILMYRILKENKNSSAYYAKEGAISANLRLKRKLYNRKITDKKNIISSINAKLFQVISVYDYFFILLKFFSVAVKRRLLKIIKP